MTRLPRDISGQRLVKALQKIGFEVKRQRGSHIVMRRKEPFTVVTIPNHKAIRPGLLNDILHDVNLSVDDFITLL